MSAKHTIFLTAGLSLPQIPDFYPAVSVYDPVTREIKIKTDRFGRARIYYAFNGESAALGTSFEETANLASAKKLDWLGIGGFLCFGFFPDDLTYYEDVKILKPATEYVFSADGKLLGQKRYWDWKYEPDRRRTQEETVDEFARIFHEVMREQTASGRIAVPISGGLDSRATVAALEKIGADKKRFWAYSYGYSEGSVETKIAAEVAEEGGLSFQSFTIKPYLFEKIGGILAAVEGFQDITQARQAFAAEEIKAQADFVICAHWGDVWLDSMLKTRGESAVRSTEKLTEIIFEKITKKGSRELLRLFKNQIPSDLDARLKGMIRRKLEELSEIKEDDFRIKAFKTDWWSFRWTLTSMRVFETAAKPLLPFYDDRLADFFMTVPSEYMTGRKLQIEYLKKYAPALAKIKWQDYDADLYSYENFNTLHLPKRIFNKILRILFPQKAYSRNWEVQFLDSRGQNELSERLLKQGLKIHGFVPGEDLRSEIYRFYQKPCASGGYVLSMLLTVAAELERLK